MEWFCCLQHTGRALDEAVARTEHAPVMEPYEGERTCQFCDEQATYRIGGETKRILQLHQSVK